jgi:SAM-dependent methyltransferase
MPCVHETKAVASSPSAYGDRAAGHAPVEIYEALWAGIGKDVSGTVLDCGSGRGNWLGYLARCPRVTARHAVDFVDTGAGARPDTSFHRCDLSREALPFSSGEVDWIFAIEVIEHLENPRFFVREAIRVLKAGGKLVLTTPNNSSFRARLSLLLRGWFPSFSEDVYRTSGHITAVLPLDLRRMAREANASVRFDYPMPGNLPGLRWKWQTVAPFLRGELWSDFMFAVVTRE